MINLRQRSAFSFRHAFGQLPEVMDCVGSDYAALTDRASTFGHIRWSELCKKHGKRPIFGVELGVFEHFAAKKSPSFYATFLATKSVEKINEIFSAATERFKYEPRLSYDDLSSFCDLGNGIVILGDRCNFDLLHPGDNIFLGVHVGTPNIVVKKASALGFKLVAVGENVYPTPFDRDAYEVLTGRNSSSQSYPQHILTRDEWLIAWGREAWAQEALDNQMLIAGQCVAELKKAKLYVPQHSSDLLEMCEAGAATKGVDLTDPVYAERLEREISVIRAKSFADYFYIIADLMKFAKANMFCGPARGSSCGSLVCYLLDITTVDPIKFDLIFERFIDLNRSDLPDIDIDLSDEKRHLVFDYLKSKYGVDNVAQLGTIAFYKSASTINEVCGALGISKYDDVVSKFTSTVEDRDEGHPRVNDCIADALAGEAGKRLLAKFPEFSIAKRIEGHPRHYSRHAAGVIITSEPILSHVAVDRKTFSTQCEKRDAEKSDMLKIDLLGLIQLSIFDHAIELLGKPRDWLLNYPLDDPEAFRIFNSGHLTGVFQFAGNALREMTKKVNVENFEDIVSLTSLARPGPMQSGGADQWIKCKTGVSEIIYDHPSLEPILRNTYGCVVFQEQVMRICREIGQMEWTDVSALRKAMGKTMGVEYFDKWRDKFIPGALATGFSKDDAEWFWRKLCENGSYLFNRCISGDTEIRLSGGHQGPITIKEMYRRYILKEGIPVGSRKYLQNHPFPKVLSLMPNGRVFPQVVKNIHKNGVKPCYRFTFENGAFVECTMDHQFIINGIMSPVSNASIDDVFTFSEYEKHKIINGRGKGHCAGSKYGAAQSGFASGDGNPSWVNGTTPAKTAFAERHINLGCDDCKNNHPRMEVHHNDFVSGTDRPDNLSWLCPGCHKKRHYANGRLKRFEKGHKIVGVKLTSVEFVGDKETYDLEMPEAHNFALANGLITHNSHAVAYSHISYWCAVLKARHPTEFAAATLSAESDNARIIALLKDLDREGISYVPFDAGKSKEKWTVIDDKTILGPLSGIKNIGPAAVKKIIDYRENRGQLTKSLEALLKNPVTAYDSIRPIHDRFPDVFERPFDHGIASKITPIEELTENENNRTVVVIAEILKLNDRDKNDPYQLEKRNGKVFSGKTRYLSMNVSDDTGSIYVNVSTRDYDDLAQEFLERGVEGRPVYILRGRIGPGYRLIHLERKKFLGFLDIKKQQADMAECA